MGGQEIAGLEADRALRLRPHPCATKLRKDGGLRVCAGLTRVNSGSLHAAAAGGGHDAVHAQVFDHLAVVVHEVCKAEGGHPGAGA